MLGCWRADGLWHPLSGAPISRRFEADPVFDFYAATIMAIAIGYDLACFDDLRPTATGTSSEFDQRFRHRRLPR
jgi:hypothetical protein